MLVLNIFSKYRMCTGMSGRSFCAFTRHYARLRVYRYQPYLDCIHCILQFIYLPAQISRQIEFLGAIAVSATFIILGLFQLTWIRGLCVRDHGLIR